MNDTPVACQTREPTDPQGDRWRAAPDEVSLPGHFAPAAIRLPVPPPAGAFRAPARVSFFWCQKKDTKENHSDLRSKDPLARYAPRRPSNSTTRNRPIAQRCRSKGLCPVLFPLPLRCRCPLPRSGIVILPFRAAEDIGPYTRLSNLFVGAGCPHPPAAPARTQKPSP